MPVLKSETRIKQIDTTDPATNVNEYASGDIVYEEGKGFKRHDGSAFVGIQSEFDGMFINTGIVEKLTNNGDVDSAITELYDCALSQVFFNSHSAGDWRVNLTNFEIGLNSATNVIVILQQDGTPFYPTSLSISDSENRNPTTTTMHWAGGEAPDPTPNGIDVFSFTIFKLSNNSVHYVLAQMVPFKGIG